MLFVELQNSHQKQPNFFLLSPTLFFSHYVLRRRLLLLYSTLLPTLSWSYQLKKRSTSFTFISKHPGTCLATQVTLSTPAHSALLARLFRDGGPRFQYFFWKKRKYFLSLLAARNKKERSFFEATQSKTEQPAQEKEANKKKKKNLESSLSPRKKVLFQNVYFYKNFVFMKCNCRLI